MDYENEQSASEINFGQVESEGMVDDIEDVA